MVLRKERHNTVYLYDACNRSDSHSDDENRLVPNKTKYRPRQSTLMPSLARYIRGIRAVGLKEWWHQLQYIGDVKAGTFMGSDQCVVIQFICRPANDPFVFFIYSTSDGRRPQVRKPLFRESQRRTGSARYVLDTFVYPLSCVRAWANPWNLI